MMYKIKEFLPYVVILFLLISDFFEKEPESDKLQEYILDQNRKLEEKTERLDKRYDNLSSFTDSIAIENTMLKISKREEYEKNINLNTIIEIDSVYSEYKKLRSNRRD